jgi:hypothetical protein
VPGPDADHRERNLQLVLSEYADHYNSHRPHRALNQRPPAGRPHPPALGTNARVMRRDRLGGLIHEYSRSHEVTGFSASTGNQTSLMHQLRKGTKLYLVKSRSSQI